MYLLYYLQLEINVSLLNIHLKRSISLKLLNTYSMVSWKCTYHLPQCYQKIFVESYKWKLILIYKILSKILIITVILSFKKWLCLNQKIFLDKCNWIYKCCNFSHKKWLILLHFRSEYKIFLKLFMSLSMCVTWF